MADTLRVGLIGLGKMGTIRARELRRHAHVRLVCGADPDERTFSEYPGMECCTEHDRIIASDVDAVFIATPNCFTADLVIRALDAGKHVFSEKPPGRSLAEIQAIRDAEQRNPRCKLMFGFNHRYHAGILEAKRIVESGRLGRIMWMRGIYGKSGGANYEKQWRSSKEMCGGGILLDQGIHMVDLLRFFSGEFVEVKSMCATAYWDAEVEDNAFALLRTPDGRIAMLHSSSTHWKHRFTLEIYMTDGYLSVNGILSSTRSYGDETISMARRQFDEGFAQGKPREEIIYFDTDPSWELEVADFLRYVAEDVPVATGTSYDALKVLELVEAIYRDDQRFQATGNRQF